MSFRYHYIYYNKVVRNCTFNIVISVGQQINPLQKQIELLTLQLSVRIDKPFTRISSDKACHFPK